MTPWLTLITTLPTENATLRQRAWRALKSSGAAVLRDGVYLMPDRAHCLATLEALALEVREGGGAAYVLRVEQPMGANFESLFDRSQAYSALLQEVDQAKQGLTAQTVQEVTRQARKLRKAFAALAETDFFPGQAQQQVDGALADLELACAVALSPDEPRSRVGVISRLHRQDYQGRLWATRARPWVDRLASAWLILRCIDSKARIVWLADAKDCPPDALGFDYDGAAFGHIGNKVTFEVLAASFGLDQPALARMGQLVHYLDVGGAQPPEAVGVERVLSGLREAISNDDALLNAALVVLDGLFGAYDKAEP
jgi:hypothetical protein